MEVHHGMEIRKSSEHIRSIALTPYQLQQSLLFYGYDHISGKMTPFSALNGFLDDNDREILQSFGTKVAYSLTESTTIKNDLNGLIDFAGDQNNSQAANVLKKIKHVSTCVFITKDHLMNQKKFDQLPQSTQVVFAEAAEQGIPYNRFLQNDGVLMHLKLKKPSREYLKAIEDNTKGMNVETKIAIAQSPNAHTAIIRTGHNFIHINCLPKSASSDVATSTYELNQSINEVIDRRIEPKYAGYILRKNLIAKEMEAVFISIGSLLSTIAIINLTINRTEDNIVLNSLIKAMTPVLQDLVTYYSQIKPFLTGKTGKEKWEKIKMYAGPAAVGIIGQSLGGVVAQQVGETSGPIPGSIIYGGIPFLHSVYTAITTIGEFKKEKGITWRQAIREISRHNPAVNALLASSFITFLTSIGVLGVGNQFNNGVAIGLIEGGEEHALTALFTHLQIELGTSKQFDMWAKREIENNYSSIFMN